MQRLLMHGRCWARGVTARWGALLAILLLVTLPLPVASAQTVRPGSTSIHEIVANPSAYYGETVTVVGALESGLGPRTFVLEDDDLLYNDSLLVASVRPAVNENGEPIDMRDVVAVNLVVTGIVRPFDLVAVGQEINFDLADEDLAGWAGKPMLVARSVVEWSPDYGPVTGLPAGAQTVVEATVDQIATRPSVYYADTVAVTGKLEDSIGWRSFVMQDDDWLFNEKLLVISSRPLLDRYGQPLRIPTFATQEAAVRVVGHVRDFNLADIEQELGLDLDDPLYTEWTGRPVLIATSVRLPRTSPFPGPGGPAFPDQSSP